MAAGIVVGAARGSCRRSSTIDGVSPRLKVLGPLVLWTVFVWLSRLRNVWSDEDLTTNGQLLRTGYAAVFLIFGVGLAVRLWARRGQPLTSGDRRFLVAFLVWTVGFWLIRGIGIIVDDHEVGFTVIHTVLMIISLSIAGLAATALRPGSPADASEPLASASS